MQVIHNAEETRACGAVGSALPWHGRGREFESHQVHQNISNTYRSLPSQTRSHRSPTGVQTQTVHGQPWAPMWISMLPTTRSLDSMSWRAWAVWASFFTLVVCWRRQHLVSYTGGCPSRRAQDRHRRGMARLRRRLTAGCRGHSACRLGTNATTLLTILTILRIPPTV